jgi:hypothetical protein
MPYLSRPGPGKDSPPAEISSLSVTTSADGRLTHDISGGVFDLLSAQA